MEKHLHQFVLLQIPEPPHRDALLLTRQLQQEAAYHDDLRTYINEERAQAWQLPLLEQASHTEQPAPADSPQQLHACLAYALTGL